MMIQVLIYNQGVTEFLKNSCKQKKMIKALTFISKEKKTLNDNYLLVGDNDFLYLFIKKQILDNSQDEREIFTFDFANKSEKLDKLINVLGTQDLFTKQKFIIIKNINKLSKKNSEILMFHIKSNNPHQVLCIDSSFLSFNYQKKTNIIKNSSTKEFSKILNVVDISTPFESEMGQWIKLFAQKLDLKISNNYSKKIIEFFGNNLSEIFNEMSKSSLVCDNENELIDSLEKVGFLHKDKQLWELNYAICDKRIDKIFENGLSIMKQYGLSYVINSMFNIIEAIFLTKKNNGTFLESFSRNIRGNVIKRISSASNNYTLEELEHAINAFSKIDIKLKTQRIIDEAEFANIINGVFKGE